MVAQGQENTARADLSFIERALFAAKLAETGFDTQVVMSALSVNKTVVPKMASFTSQIPPEVIQAVGAARSIGRDRWYDLSMKFRTRGNADKAAAFIRRPRFIEADSDDRFNLLFNFLPAEESKARVDASLGYMKSRTRSWSPEDKLVSVTAKDTGKAFTLSLKERDGGRFGGWISENLEQLYRAFRDSETATTGD